MPKTDNFIEIRVGHFIRENRKKKGMNQDVFADHIGVNRKTLLKIEHGERLPTGKEIFGICDFLKITPNDLLSANGHIDIEPDDRNVSEAKVDEIVQFFQMVYAFFRLSPKDKVVVGDLVQKMAKADLEYGNLEEFIEKYESVRTEVKNFLLGVELSFLLTGNTDDKHPQPGTDLIYQLIDGFKNGDLSNLNNIIADPENLPRISEMDSKKISEVLNSGEFERNVSHLIDTSDGKE